MSKIKISKLEINFKSNTISRQAKCSFSVMESSDNPSFVKATNEEKEYRMRILSQILEEAKMRNDIINENYLLYKI
jgi:hypothetical protein